VGLDSAGKAAAVKMELIRKPAQMRVEIKLELLAGLDLDELSVSGSLVRSGKRGHGATAAALLRPQYRRPPLSSIRSEAGFETTLASTRNARRGTAIVVRSRSPPRRLTRVAAGSRIQIALLACISQVRRRFSP
jgi:hypothetical protein